MCTAEDGSTRDGIDSFEIVVGVSRIRMQKSFIFYQRQRYARSEYIASGQPLGIIIIIIF